MFQPFADEKSEDECPTEWALQSLLRRTEKGDETAVPKLRRLYRKDPEAWQTLEEMTLQVEYAGLGLLLSSFPDLDECLKQNLDAVRAHFAGCNPAPLEAVVAKRATLTAIYVGYFATKVEENATNDEPPGHGGGLRPRRDQAFERHQKAVNRLALVRKVLPRSRKKKVTEPQATASSEPRP